VTATCERSTTVLATLSCNCRIMQFLEEAAAPTRSACIRVAESSTRTRADARLGSPEQHPNAGGCSSGLPSPPRNAFPRPLGFPGPPRNAFRRPSGFPSPPPEHVPAPFWVSQSAPGTRSHATWVSQSARNTFRCPSGFLSAPPNAGRCPSEFPSAPPNAVRRLLGFRERRPNALENPPGLRRQRSQRVGKRAGSAWPWVDGRRGETVPFLQAWGWGAWGSGLDCSKEGPWRNRRSLSSTGCCTPASA